MIDQFSKVVLLSIVSKLTAVKIKTRLVETSFKIALTVDGKIIKFVQK
jgi:hypothetical protein